MDADFPEHQVHGRKACAARIAGRFASSAGCELTDFVLMNGDYVPQAKKMLGWQPKVELREGLSKMVDDFTKRLCVEKPAV